MDNLQGKLLKFTKIAEKSDNSFVNDEEIYEKVKTVCNNIRIKAPIRFLLSCCAAKIDNPKVDIRKPYTEISEEDSFSGRSYDEKYIQEIIEEFDLPCNSTTAYLTPAFRNRNTIMMPDTELVGRNPELYKTTLELLNLVYNETIKPEQLFKEILHQLFIIRNQNANRIEQLIKSLKDIGDKTISEVIEFTNNNNLITKDDLIRQFIEENEYLFYRVKDVKYKQIINLYNFEQDFTPYSTQHGIKGAEFENVFVILDNGKWNKYNFRYLFENAEGKERIIERTRKMFYVSCSRAKNNLVVYFNAPSNKVLEKAVEWFGKENLINIDA